MKRYTAYKDSGVKWIGEIPSHWEVIKLKNQLQLINDKCIPVGMQYIGLENIESFTGKYISSDIKAEGTANRFQKGDVLFGKLRPYLAKTYKCEVKGCCSTELLVYRSKEHPDFYKYIFLAKPFVDLIDSSTYGSKMPRANANFIGSQFIPIPPNTEQRAIVSFLDSELGRIDTYVEKEQQLIERLKELKQSVIARAVTRGINPNAKMKPSGISWIGEIPEHWKVGKIRSLFRERREKVSDREWQALSVAKDGILPQLETAVKTENGDNRKKVCAGDFVVNSRSDRKGSCGFSDYNGSVSLINIVLKPINVIGQFYHYLFRSNDYIEEFYKNGRGIVSDLWTTRYSEMRNIYIPVPPAAEQQNIVDYITAATTKIDRLIVEKTYEIEYIKELRQRIIADAVTGKIDVRESQNWKMD